MKKIIYIMALLCLCAAVIFCVSSCNGATNGSGSQISSNADTQSSTDTQNSTDITDNSTQNSTDTTQNSTGTTDSSDTGDDSGTDTSELIKYTVRAIDAFGNAPDVSVIVEMFKDGESLGERRMRQGTATFSLEAGNYTFEVKPMEGEFYYDKSACVFSEDTTEVTVTLYNYADSTSKQELWIDSGSVLYEAVSVEEGATYVEIDRAEGTYFVFTPTRGGIYRVSYEADRSVTLGYYGSPHNVLATCPLDVVDGAFEVEVKNEGVNIGNPGGTTQMVIGIRSFVVKGCVLKIERIGNPTVELPWTDVQVDKSAVKVDTYVNSEFVDFDVTDKSLSAVYNENDGYYHLNAKDGPIIYVRISSALIESVTEEETVYAYLPSFITMCETGRLGKVFYDEEGNIILKESYNTMLEAYAELCGTNGMYPLNEQLATAIKNMGEYNGWYDLDTELHIFGDNAAKVVKDNMWLFACTYENKQALGESDKPVVLSVDKADSAKTYAALLSKDTPVTLRTSANATITLNNANGIKIVANDGEEYVADGETGKLSALISANQSFTIVYEGEDDSTVVYFTFIQYVAQAENIQ